MFSGVRVGLCKQDFLRNISVRELTSEKGDATRQRNNKTEIYAVATGVCM